MFTTTTFNKLKSLAGFIGNEVRGTSSAGLEIHSGVSGPAQFTKYQGQHGIDSSTVGTSSIGSNIYNSVSGPVRKSFVDSLFSKANRAVRRVACLLL